jgi:hypothetical protein
MARAAGATEADEFAYAVIDAPATDAPSVSIRPGSNARPASSISTPKPDRLLGADVPRCLIESGISRASSGSAGVRRIFLGVFRDRAGVASSNVDRQRRIDVFARPAAPAK